MAKNDIKKVVNALNDLSFDDLIAPSAPVDDITKLARDVVNGKPSDKQSKKALVIPERATKGAAAGCKPGHTRHTYVMPIEMIEQLKSIAGYFQIPEVSVVLKILEKGIEDVKQRYGNKVVKSKSNELII